MNNDSWIGFSWSLTVPGRQWWKRKVLQLLVSKPWNVPFYRPQPGGFLKRKRKVLLLMEGILHQLIWRLSHCSQGFIDNRWWSPDSFYQQYCSCNHYIYVHCVFVTFHMAVSKNWGTPKSSILIGFSIINHPFWGFPPIFGNTHIFMGFMGHQEGGRVGRTKTITALRHPSPGIPPTFWRVDVWRSCGQKIRFSCEQTRRGFQPCCCFFCCFAWVCL